MKDAWWGHGDGTAGVFGGHTTFADPHASGTFVRWAEVMLTLKRLLSH